ncbi:30S ribosome-binding factor RbfA [Helicobacter winghamensis]|uniref:Ribosome-binding factor A n=1 Tax=Helicobacter winghamensis TaxID=157268 RepID=A0A2N3PLL8_9HELI|nr:30S ribosome-binding factor RbfA [Helicobacter winghamensis]EEO26375.1 ribosome-binding factor A [Helicobacter winghamensis ATCC BAA-430]PKT75180.1 ribosome-binding factor A [Helicobacter winghamensis]PKT75255.1 ribosome-binding factor A [Helicobacter winghamensis]PKT75297.1 ribosome-binding factor A [Helicobacter winghamensis]PKT82751.1 ribosome-binding factor A [Helicobacter winghamensis]
MLKQARTQSLLKEILPSALANLSDTRLNALNVVDVRCSRGKYFAEVFLNAPFATEKEKAEILKQLKKAHSLIKAFCLEETGWFRCPDFKFIFDGSLEQENRLDQIFEALQKERENKEKES